MAEELIIPVRLDASKAQDGLKDVGKAGHAAGDAVSSGMHQGEAAARNMGTAVKSATNETAALMKAQLSLSAARSVVQGLGEDWNRVAAEVAKTSKEYQAFRQSLQSVASLSGQKNTNQFAEGEIDRAERARVTPQEAKSFREAFLSKASLYVGNGPDARLGDQDADEVQAKMMEYAKDKGVSQEDMAGFVGGLLAQTKGKTNAKDLLARAGRVFGGLEASSAEVKHLLPMTTRAMAAGFSPEESAQTLAAMPEIAPDEESTYLLRTVSALRERIQKDEDQGASFGLKKGMKPYEMLSAAITNIRGRADRGEDLDDLITKATHGEEISGRALRGLVDQGPEGLRRWQRVVNEIPDNQIQATIDSERKTESGLQRAANSRHAVEEARMGLRNDTLTRRRTIAETELLANKDFERPPGWVEWAAGKIPGASDAHEQMINRQMLMRARGELGQSFGVGDAKASLNNGTTDALMRELIAKMDENNRHLAEQTAIMKKEENRNPVPPPMSGRPPGIRTRM